MEINLDHEMEEVVQPDHCYANCETANAKKRKIVYENSFEATKPVTTCYMDKIFEYIEELCKNTLSPKKDNCSNSLAYFEDEVVVRAKSVSEAESLEEIVNLCSELKIKYNEDIYGQIISVRGIVCEACFIQNKSKDGLFEIKPDECFETGKKGKKIQTPKFRGTKGTIRNHLLSETHGLNLEKKNGTVLEPVATKGYVKDKLQLLTNVVKKLLTNPQVDESSKKETVTVKPFDDISEAKSMDEIVQSCRHMEYFYPSEERKVEGKFAGIICSPCFAKRQAIKSKSKIGFFGFEWTEGSAFRGTKQGDQNQPGKFRDLKRSIKDHLCCKTHLAIVHEEPPAGTKKDDLQERNETIGMALGKVAYRSVVRHRSKINFEEEVAFLSDIPFDVGDINHGVEFVHSLVPIFYDVLKREVVSVLNSPMKYSIDPSPFVIFADKITPNATTLQIIGLTTLQRGFNTPLVLDITPVKNHDGRSIAQDIVNSIYRFFTPDAARKLYMGCSFDGQYLSLGVPNHILSLLGIEFTQDISKSKQAQQSFHTVSWDPAHLIELSCGDIKKGRKYSWVEVTELAVSTVNRRHTNGKQYQLLQDESLNIDTSVQSTVMRPGSFSETRFSTYKFDVLYRFNNNYPSFYNKLVKDKDDDLNLISSAQFCLRLCALEDIFNLIGITSQAVQSSHSLPWHTDSKIESCIGRLNSMIDALKNPENIGENSDLKKLTFAAEEILSRGTYKGKPVYIQQPATHTTRAHNTQIQNDSTFLRVVSRVKLEVADYLKDLVESMEARFSRNYEQTAFVSSRDAFAFDRIISRPVDCVPDTFLQYCNLARSAGLLIDVSSEKLEEEYMQFTRCMYSLHHKYKNTGQTLNECSLYAELLESCDEMYSCSNLMLVLASALVRNRSECIAETLGSIIKNHLDKRCSLSNENLKCEIFLTFNGPAPNRDSNGLIRESLNIHFGGPKWRFLRTSKPSNLKNYETSKVVDKVHKKTGRIQIADQPRK